MASTLRNTAARFHGDFSSETRGILEIRPPGSQPSPSTPNYLTCQLLEQLQPALQTLAVGIICAVETASLLHFANGGATMSLVRGNLAGQGCYAVSVHPELSVQLSSAPTIAQLFLFVLNNLTLLVASERAFGTWVDKDGLHVLDVVTCVTDRELALDLGARFGQCSIFDLAAGREILVTPCDQVHKNEVKS